MTRLALLLTLIAGLAFTATASADGPVTEDDVLDVERELTCPTCSNLRLDFCELAICHDMRSIIRERLEAGDSEQQVVDYFTSRYGDRVLVAPPREGFHVAVWLLPIAGVLLAAVGAFFVLRSWRRSPAPEHAVSPIDPRVERELADFRDEAAPWS